ncbi:MAG: MBL fold metallo-hydrolase [Deltaproteobacteria bacterium]|nr:MBL fold metallo-hydrolase [Deltaproteobacteria bacterium]
MINTISQKIEWLGHDAFRIITSKIIYFDPYQIADGPPADLILITHDHYDHCSPDDVAKIQKSGTVIVTEEDSAKKLSGDIRIMSPGESISIDGMNIEAVPSYNTNKQFHPKNNNWLGFIIEIDGSRIYHAGDTDYIPEMEKFNVDIALLPVSGTYVMTAEEAVKAALSIEPALSIPMHYGTVAGSEEDALNFKKALEGKIEVRVLNKS